MWAKYLLMSTYFHGLEEHTPCYPNRHSQNAPPLYPASRANPNHWVLMEYKVKMRRYDTIILPYAHGIEYNLL